MKDKLVEEIEFIAAKLGYNSAKQCIRERSIDAVFLSHLTYMEDVCIINQFIKYQPIYRYTYMY